MGNDQTVDSMVDIVLFNLNMTKVKQESVRTKELFNYLTQRIKQKTGVGRKALCRLLFGVGVHHE